MTLTRSGTRKLTQEEMAELNALREAINYSPQTVSPHKMEKFTELFVRSLEGKGDPTPFGSQNKYHYHTTDAMTTIDQHIQKDKSILEDPTISPQSRRHIEGELEALESYKQNHPEDTHDPTPLELFCDTNPGALECKMFDD